MRPDEPTDPVARLQKNTAELSALLERLSVRLPEGGPAIGFVRAGAENRLSRHENRVDFLDWLEGEVNSAEVLPEPVVPIAYCELDTGIAVASVEAHFSIAPDSAVDGKLPGETEEARMHAFASHYADDDGRHAMEEWTPDHCCVVAVEYSSAGQKAVQTFETWEQLEAWCAHERKALGSDISFSATADVATGAVHYLHYFGLWIDEWKKVAIRDLTLPGGTWLVDEL